MEYVSGFVWETLSTGAVSAVLVAAAGFLSKSKIQHWLNRDIEKQKIAAQKELEILKAAQLRDLESYKTSLIAYAEQAKASQSVRTSVALKFSEHQFTAINEISRAYADLGRLVISFYETAWIAAEEDFRAQCDEWTKRSDALTHAIFAGMFFMAEADVHILQNYDSLLAGICQLATYRRLQRSGYKESAPVSEITAEFFQMASEADRIAYVRKREAAVTQVLRKYADRFLGMQPTPV